MATQTDEITSEFGKPDLALKMNQATVKVIMGNAVWTGTIVGQKAGKTLILTVAHTILESAGWMQVQELQRIITVQFYNTIQLLPCRIIMLEKKSDIMMLVVDRVTPEHHTLNFAPEEEWELVESQLLGARGHPMGQHEWTLADGKVCTPNLRNTGFYNVMPKYYEDMRFFEHRLDLREGYSGAALVNLKGNIVGMQSGMTVRNYEVLCSTKMIDALEARIVQLKHEYNVKKDTMNPGIFESMRENLESGIKEATVGLENLQYGREDALTIPFPLSQIKYAIHVEFIKNRIQGNGNRSLEDIFIPDAAAAASSSSGYY